MRNGDYIPTRLEAQHDAANFLVGRKTQSNPENTVGVIAMSSSNTGAELLVSPTDDMGKILAAVNDVSITTTGIDLTVSIQVASLALKHRRNKNGAQRIVVFVGSPLSSNVDSKALSKAGRMLKKNNVAIDIIAMGELDDNQDKLKELVDAANGNANNVDSDRMCHLVTIPAGVLPSDVLLSSPIVSGSGGGSAVGGGASELNQISAGGGGGFADYGGVDPNMDPELAMALRVSMEEERARQERLAASSSAAEETKQDTGSSSMDIDSNAVNTDAATSTTVPVTTVLSGDDNVEVADEDALLQQALAMSMAEDSNENDNVGAHEQSVEVSASEEKMQEDIIDEDDEDAAIQLALQMSMQPDTDDAVDETAATTATTQPRQQFQDPNFVNQLLGSLPGVDPNDPAIQSALRNLQENQSSSDENKDSKEDDNSKKEDS